MGGASLGGTTGTMSGGSGGLANGGVSNQQPTTVWNLTDYASYLGFMADTAIAKGATPIFVTPMGHRTFTGTNFNNTLLPYAQSMKGEASAKGLKGVDLNLRSGEYYEKVGNAFLTTNIFDGGTTHFIKAGAVEMATLIAGELKKQNGRLAPYMR